MKLELESGETHEYPDDMVIAQMLASLDGETNSFAILSASDWTYIQAAVNADGTCFLEYQDGGVERHFQVESAVSLEQVIAAFQMYNRGDPAWKQAHTWKRMTF